LKKAVLTAFSELVTIIPDYMKPLLRSLGVIAVFSALILSQGCATIFGGRTNKLVFTGSNDVQAQVFIDDTLRGEAYGEIVLNSRIIQHGSMLEIRADGYPTQEYVILRKPHTGYIIADFAVGGIPLIFDIATGQLLRPKPRKFEVDFTKQD
jgi:hypothetical protein